MTARGCGDCRSLGVDAFWSSRALGVDALGGRSLGGRCPRYDGEGVKWLVWVWIAPRDCARDCARDCDVIHNHAHNHASANAYRIRARGKKTGWGP